MTARIAEALERVAFRFGPKARETILYEEGRKHRKEVRDIMAAGRDVVDLGGGLGINLLVLRELGHDGRLVLVDRFEEYDAQNRMGPWKPAVELLRDAGIAVIQQDFWPEIQLPLEEGAFDVACCYDVVEHLPGNPLPQMRELRRVLRAGGTCLLAGPNAASLMKRLKLLAGHHPYGPFEDWMQERYYDHFREYTRWEYEEILRRSGFQNVTSEPSTVVTLSRARHRYHRRKRPLLSPVTGALLGLAAAEALIPGARHLVYAAGRVPGGAEI